MRWTTELPKEDGWFWHRDSDGGDGVVVYVGPDESERLRAYGWGTDYDETLIDSLGGEWAGPIMPPENYANAQTEE